MIKINLLAEQKAKPSRTNRWRVSVAVICLVLIGTAIRFLLLRNQRLLLGSSSTHTVPVLSEGETTKQREGEEKGGVAESSEQDTTKGYLYSYILMDILVNIPPSVRLSTIGFVLPDECFIQGKAASISLAKELAQRLGRLPGVKRVESPSVERLKLEGGSAEFDFTVWMKIDFPGSRAVLADSVDVRLFMAQVRRQAEECGAVLGRWVLKEGRLTFHISGKSNQIESFLAAFSQSDRFSNLVRLFILPAEGEGLSWERVRASFCFDLSVGEGR